MTRKSYTYWYDDKPLYHWCQDNDISYLRCIEVMHKWPEMNVKEAVEYVKVTTGTAVKYIVDGISVRKRLGKDKYIKFMHRMERNRKLNENKTWQEIYESCL